MPIKKYEVTLSDGKKYEVDWDGDEEPSLSDFESALSSADTPQVSGPTLFGRTLDTVGRIGQTIGRLGSATAAVAKEGVEAAQQGQDLGGFLGDALGAVKNTFTPDTTHGYVDAIGKWKQNTDFNDVLKQAGMDEGWKRSVLGFAGDVVLDPLNLLGVGAVKAAYRSGVGKTADVVGDLARKSETLTSGRNALAKTFGAERIAPEMIDNVAGSLTHGLSYDEMKRLAASAQRSAGEHGEDVAVRFFKGKTKEKGFKDLLYAIDEGRTTGNANLDTLIPGWQQTMDDLWEEQRRLGLVKPDQKLANYVQYQTKGGRPADVVVGANLNALPNSARAREKFKTLQDAVKFGEASDDPVEVLSHSIAQVEKAKNTDEFIRSVKSAFGKVHPVKGYRKLNVKNIKAGPQLAKDLHGTFLPTAIADDMERAVKLWEEPNELHGLYKTGMKIWKTFATALNPGHHFTNFMGNIHNMYVSGMSTREMGKWIPRAYGMAKQKSGHTWKSVGGHSGDDLYKLAHKYEIIGTLHQLGETVAHGKGEKIANNALFRAARRLGTQGAEEPARLALWLNEIEKGSSPAKAALRVKDVLFDYSELSKLEKNVRDLGIIPFYTWMRKNIPLQLQMMVENPERVERVKDLIEVPWNAKESEMEQAILPERAQRAGYVPSYLNTTEGAPVLNRLALPAYDVNKLTDLGSLGDVLGPLPKLLIEGVTGEKFFGGTVDKSMGLTTPAPAAALLSVLNPILPDSMEGIITATDVNGRPMQHDRMSWIMNTLFPTGVYGSTAKLALGEDPMQPHYDSQTRALGLRLAGMSPDSISAVDQEFEAKDRVAEWKRQQMRRILMEQ